MCRTIGPSSRMKIASYRTARKHDCHTGGKRRPPCLSDKRRKATTLQLHAFFASHYMCMHRIRDPSVRNPSGGQHALQQVCEKSIFPSGSLLCVDHHHDPCRTWENQPPPYCMCAGRSAVDTCRDVRPSIMRQRNSHQITGTRIPSASERWCPFSNLNHKRLSSGYEPLYAVPKR